MPKSFILIASHFGAPLFQPRRDQRHVGTIASLAFATIASVMFAVAPAQATGAGVDRTPSQKQACSGAGTIWWSELLAPETEKLTDFYAKVIGWKVKTVDAEDPTRPAAGPEDRYTMFLSGDQEVAGLMKTNHPAAAHSGVGWLTYIEVDDVDETVKKVKASGGKVIREAVESESGDKIAMINDPAGNVFGIVAPADKPAC